MRVPTEARPTGPAGPRVGGNRLRPANRRVRCSPWCTKPSFPTVTEVFLNEIPPSVQPLTMAAMWPCKDIDLAWPDWTFAVRACLSPSPAEQITERVASLWSTQLDAVACLTVRSAFDLYLRAQRWHAGSEMVFSALTVPDMPRIARYHGLRPVPLDVDPLTAAWDARELERCVGPRTRAVVLAHLFGARTDLHPAIEVARRRGVAVVEDCAQAYAGPGWKGHPEADLSLFSFGPMKTATALGGALATVRDPGICAAMEGIHARDGVQTTAEYLHRVMLYGLLKAASHHDAFGVVVAMAKVVGVDWRQWTDRLTRNMASATPVACIRRRPCAALLSVLARRLEQGTVPVARRVDAGRTLMAALGPDVEVPGRAADPHGYWMFPVLSRDPEALSSILGDHGFDARQARLSVVSDDATPTPGADRLSKALCVPFDPAMPEEELERLGGLVRALEGMDACKSGSEGVEANRR